MCVPVLSLGDIYELAVFASLRTPLVSLLAGKKKGNTTNTRERVFRRMSNTEKRVGTTLLSEVFLSELRGALILR